MIAARRSGNRIPEELRRGDWLTVRHLSSEEARPLLAQAAAGLLVGRSPHPYNDIAVSVKLFEYMSYGLPMVYVRNAPTQRILDGCGAGVGAAFDPDSFAGAVRELFADPDRYQEYRRCSAQAPAGGKPMAPSGAAGGVGFKRVPGIDRQQRPGPGGRGRDAGAWEGLCPQCPMDEGSVGKETGL